MIKIENLLALNGILLAGVIGVNLAKFEIQSEVNKAVKNIQCVNKEEKKTVKKIIEKKNIITHTKTSDTNDIIAVSRLVNVYSNTESAKQKIINAIIKYSKEYNIDPMTLAALLAKESSFNKSAEHSAVFVKVPVKKNWTKIKTAKVRAQGMGGVIYEIWKYELKEIGISKTDLKNINSNIKATAMILSTYIHERKQLKGTKSREASGLLRYYGVIRKNGVPDKTYSKSVYEIKQSVI